MTNYCTSPIDISIENVKGKCDLKCSFSYKYDNTSSAIAINRDKYLSLSFEKTERISPVSFNNTKFFISEIRIYQPSLHSFRGSKKDAEIIIVHQSDNGDDIPLLLCIPISQANYNNSYSFTSILDTISSNAPTQNNKTTIKSFSVSDWLPPKSTPFFTYQATTPYPPCTDSQVNFIVYDNSIYISDSSMQKLKNIIKSNDIKIKTGIDFFINKNGANTSTNSNDNEIYIDCQPTWISDETVIKPNTSSNESKGFSPETLNYLYLFFISSFLFAVFLFFYNFLFTKKNLSDENLLTKFFK